MDGTAMRIGQLARTAGFAPRGLVVAGFAHRLVPRLVGEEGA